jgi:hypothetical protein
MRSGGCRQLIPRREFGNQNIEKALNKSVAAYRKGHPVVVTDEEWYQLHGEDFSKVFVTSKCRWRPL